MQAYGRVAIEACEHYQKGSYRNRCYLAGANGPLRLSLPLESGKHQQLPIREVRTLEPKAWARPHWASIRSAYGKAPFFEHFAPGLQAFFDGPTRALFENNLRLIRWILAELEIAVTIECTSTYLPPQPAGFADFRDELRPGKPEGSEFVPHPYPQVFEDKHGFLPNMSILDLLFCAGPQAAVILRASLNLPKE